MKKIFNSRALALILVLAMTLAMFTIGASATTISDVSIAEGESVAIDWTQNGTTYTGTIVNSATLSSTVYSMPSSFILWTVGNPTITLDEGITKTFLDTSADNTSWAHIIDVSGIPSGSTATMTVEIASGTYTVELPAATPVSVAGSKPTSVVSYAPLGQFARGTSWGSIYSNYSNTEGATASDALVKFASGTGYSSVGVSLGAFGGYIDYYFQGGITNDAKNPYGVDFVIYGNAFNANPEAGAVQVSEDGITWYELAGSQYYEGNFAVSSKTQASGKFSKGYSGTLRNATVNYTGTSSKISAVVTAGTKTMTVDPLINSYGWWPTAAKGYPAIGAHVNSNSTGTSNVQVACNDTTFSSTGLTLIPDSDTTADYAYGYADVTPNGSPATYGDAVNPYTPYTSSKTGGDGFDLEWAVDITTGLPVDVTGKTFRYVRVYSAVLDNGQFGETSTEICGIFTTANKSTATVGRTDEPILEIDGTNIYDMDRLVVTPTSYGLFIDATEAECSDVRITATSTATANIYFNNEYTDTFDRADREYVRVIVQDGTAAPFMALIKF